jgi:Secretion system C-terminal sorting domain
MRKSIFSLLITGLFIITCTYSVYASQDSLAISGKGMYLWQIWSTNNGGKNLGGIINKLKSVGATWLVIKMADGDSYYNSPNHSLYNWVKTYYGNMDSVVTIFHSFGIKLLAFQYVYGVPHYWGDALSETDVANSILSIKGIDGLIIDAEIQYDTLESRNAAAQAYCDSIQAHHPNAFIGLTAWARVDGHNTFPWITFLSRVNVNMPQTYWAARPTTVQNELSLMSSQFTYWTKTWVSLGDSAVDKPIMPLGQGEYFGYSNDVEQGDITTFCNLCQTTYSYPGVSLWEYNQITHPYVWDEYAAAWDITLISGKKNEPLHYNLLQNYPNPFNPSTSISYTIEEISSVTLKVYDILGREVSVLVKSNKPAGTYNVNFDAANLSSGIYFYKLEANSLVSNKKFTKVDKMMLLK